MPGEPQFKCKAESIANDGSGIVSVVDDGAMQGRKYFVPSAAPDDFLLCKVTDEKKHRAEIVEIIEASNDRCPVFCKYCAGYSGTETGGCKSELTERCGACTLQHINYDAQIKHKLNLLYGILCRNNIKTPIKTVPSQQIEYRNRIQLHSIVNAVSEKRNLYKLDIAKNKKQNVGFMPQRGNNIIPIDDCPICSPIIRESLRNRTIKAPLDKDRFTIYGKDNLLLSESEKQTGIYNFCGKQIKVSANSFFQSNGGLLEELIKDITAIAETADRSLTCGDFYCGVGTFGVFLQDIFSNLVLFDQNKSALSIARENVRYVGHKNPCNEDQCGAEFFAFDDDRFVKTFKSRNSVSAKRFGFAVADPARTGLSPLMCKWLCENKPKILCYVSCNPTALVRDAKQLLASSYKLQSITYYDFYPHTAHIETLSVFVAADSNY
ncbi:MAG: 23S rRNA (uracil(1939)-C(5))-methyltransferase RlmD [Termitinemataceae bacterium]|nr:MAG: 23S rRNA (uracil(1939)-C(5))-methyltransferase RlmD [Termitinemataceae bacterium]